VATHQVQLSLQRAARRPRACGSLGTYAALLSLLGGAAGAGLCCVGLVLVKYDWGSALGLGLAGATGGAVLMGVLAARLSASVGAMAQAARQVAGGDFRVQLPSGPGSEMGKLTGAFNQMMAAIADDRKRLQELNLALEERLRRRSLEAEQRSQELEQFVYTASHDLRAPVLSIQGFATLLQRNLSRKLDEQSREHLLRIRTNAEAMDLLLRDLLEVSRAGKVQEAKELVHSREIVASVLRDLEPEMARLRVTVKVAEGLPAILYSPRLLARVFRNLIDNAIKFMGDQPMPAIAIGYERSPDGHRFSVEDNGAGIRPEDRERVFGLFARAEGARAPGSGVGLAIVRRIVESHGGRVWVQSQPGAGSTFFFTAPAGGSEIGVGEGGQ